MCSVPGYDASSRVEDLAVELKVSIQSIAIGMYQFIYVIYIYVCIYVCILLFYMHEWSNGASLMCSLLLIYYYEEF